MIDVILELVDIPVPTAFAGAKQNTRNMPPLVRQMTSEEDFSADEEALKIAGLTVDLAGDVTVGVAPSADLVCLANQAVVVTAGVASSADPAVVPLASYDGDVTAGVTSMEECVECEMVLSDCVCDYDDYHYDSHYDDCPGYYDYDAPDDYDGSYRDYDDYDGCGDNGDYDGDVTADVSSLKKYKGHDIIRSDVILPQTDSDESSAVLEISVLGAVGTGAVWSQTGGGGGAEGTKKDFIVDTGCQETILETSVGEQMCVANPRLVSADSSPLVAPHALWGHNTLELTDAFQRRPGCPTTETPL